MAEPPTKKTRTEEGPVLNTPLGGPGPLAQVFGVPQQDEDLIDLEKLKYLRSYFWNDTTWSYNAYRSVLVPMTGDMQDPLVLGRVSKQGVLFQRTTLSESRRTFKIAASQTSGYYGLKLPIGNVEYVGSNKHIHVFYAFTEEPMTAGFVGEEITYVRLSKLLGQVSNNNREVVRILLGFLKSGNP